MKKVSPDGFPGWQLSAATSCQIDLNWKWFDLFAETASCTAAFGNANGCRATFLWIPILHFIEASWFIISRYMAYSSIDVRFLASSATTTYRSVSEQQFVIHSSQPCHHGFSEGTFPTCSRRPSAILLVECMTKKTRNDLKSARGAQWKITSFILTSRFLSLHWNHWKFFK